MSTENLSNNPHWLVLQDGRMGTDGQARGLAEAMGLSYKLHHINLSWWQRLLPVHWVSKFIAPSLFISFKSKPMGIIGAGRQASYGLLAARHIWPEIRSIQIQNPHVDPAYFTHLIAPQHDAITGMNVITTLGGLHAVTDQRLDAAKQQWRVQLEKFPSPRVAVLIGGNNKHVQLNAAWIDQLATQLNILHQSGHSLWITASRRTPPELAARLRAALPQENVFFWNGSGDNPYMGFLALADLILVTADSVSMMSESLSTDKPVALLRVPGTGKKFTRFHDALIAGNYTHWFQGSWQIAQRPRLQETQRVAMLLLK